MSPKFSVVYPTRHRPQFVRHALRILERQEHDDFEVIVADNYIDTAQSCEMVCRESGLTNLRYVVPPRPVGMVENWNFALPFATGDYVCYLTDKMFLLPGALGRVAGAVESAGRPEIVTWTSDAYNPESYSDYFGAGRYFVMSAGLGSRAYRRYSTTDELDRRGRGTVARTEQSSADYCRGKLVFGAYRRDLVERIVDRYGALFHNVNADYTSMILGLTEGNKAIELNQSCVVSLNTDISNGRRSDTDDAAALEFISSLAGGADQILKDSLVPGLYASLHNLVAHDFLTLKRRFNLRFAFDAINWLTYCFEDIFRAGRTWSDPRVEEEQKRLLQTYIDSLDAASSARLLKRIARRARPAPDRPSLGRRLKLHRRSQNTQDNSVASPSVYDAAVYGGHGR